MINNGKMAIMGTFKSDKEVLKADKEDIEIRERDIERCV